MRRSVLLPQQEFDIESVAAQVEADGYDGVWIGELWGQDAFVTLARIAQATETIEFGTSIVNIFGRSPATLAQAAVTLADLSDDRMVLGLGVSTKKAIEDLHSRQFDNPPRRLHETVELTKQFISSDERVSYNGEVYAVTDFPGLDRDIPVYTAALGPGSRRATGRTADGWLPHNIPFSQLSSAHETITEAAEAVGRDPESVTVAPWVPAAVAENEATAKDEIRGHVAYYVGSGEGYRQAVASEFPEEAEAVATNWRNGDRGEAAAAVTDEMVAELGVAGQAEEARSQLSDIESNPFVDETIVVTPVGADEELTMNTIDALAPSR